jgi:hypothetical protein
MQGPKFQPSTVKKEKKRKSPFGKSDHTIPAI